MNIYRRDYDCPDCPLVTGGDCGEHGPLPISGGAIAPLAMLLLPLLPQLIDSAVRIYEQIANHPTTPEATATQIRGYLTNIRALNAQIQRAPLPGDEP